MKTYPLEHNPLVSGVQEGFKTEAEAIAVWRTLKNPYEFKVKYITTPLTGEVIAVVFEKGNPEDYKTFYKFGEIN
jgi:hypothetical protein